MIVAISIGIEIKIGKFSTLDDMIVPMNTKNNPIAPPIKHNMMASSRNSKRILLFLAPIAFFNPITAVLSFTVTNMILAIPNNPTIRLIPPTIPPTIFNTEKNPVMALLKASTLFNEKSSSSVGLNFLICRIIPCNSSLSASVVTPSLPLVIKMGLAYSTWNSCLQKV